MREINDQYPEYAEPYEPVKGGKHHKGIYGTRGPDRRNSPRRFLFFALIGLLLLLLVSTGPGGELAGTEPLRRLNRRNPQSLTRRSLLLIRKSIRTFRKSLRSPRSRRQSPL